MGAKERKLRDVSEDHTKIAVKPSNKVRYQSNINKSNRRAPRATEVSFDDTESVDKSPIPLIVTRDGQWKGAANSSIQPSKFSKDEQKAAELADQSKPKP